MSALKKFASVMLALLVGLLMPGQVASSATSSTIACHCCNSKQAQCRTSACCVRHTDNQTPATPATPPATPQYEWHALAATITVLKLPSVSFTSLPTAANFSPSLTALPLFQRDCSYLI